MQWHLGAVSIVVAGLVLSSGCAQKVDTHPSLFAKVLKDDIKVGTGLEPIDGDTVHIEYIGTLPVGGAQFDTNNPDLSEKSKNPLSFELGANSGMVSGLVEGIRGMRVGGQRKVSIPWKSAYGEGGRDGIPPYSDLVFDVKLLYVLKKADENSIEIKDLVQGTGAGLKVGDTAEVQYNGMFVNNRVFDSTYLRKKSVSFKLGKAEAITGFEKGIEGMKVGGKRRVTLAPGAGWGSYGTAIIPPNAVLIYDVELVSIK